MAFSNTSQDLQITRLGDVITIFPAGQSLKDAVATLRALPKPQNTEIREPVDIPDRTIELLAYLIDTNIAIHARDGTEAVLAKLEENDGAVLLSALTLVELQRGLFKNPEYTSVRRVRLDVLLQHIPVLPFTAAAAVAYGDIIAACGWVKGRDYDRMIAAHALVSGSTLVTANETDFLDIPGLKIENWTTR